MATPRKPKETHQKPISHKYSADYARQAAIMVGRGLRMCDIASVFEVSEASIYVWEKKYPEFAEAIRDGRTEQKDRVVRALFERAVGYEHPEDKIFCQNGKTIIEKTTKHYPPDTVACIFYLKNRDPENWKDKKDIEVPRDVKFVFDMGLADEED